VSTAVELAIFFRAPLVEHRLLPEGLLHHMKSVLPDDPRPPSPTGWADRRPHAVRCGVESLRHGVRLPALAIPALGAGCFAIFRVNGSYGFRVASQASAEVPSDPSPGVRASVYC